MRNRTSTLKFMWSGKVISIAVLSVLLLFAVVLYVPHVVYTATYGKVTHNSIPHRLIQGVDVTPLPHKSNSHLIDERAALKITNPTMKYYEGTSRDIELVSTSVPTGPTYQSLSSSKIAGDPNFTRSDGLWENIPCYIVMIEDPRRQMVFDTPKDGAGNTSLSTFVITFVDATNGKILYGYVTSVPKVS